MHEHPEKSKAWEMPEITELMAHAEVGSVVLDMCAFGMTSTDEQGEAPVKKGTRLMSSSDEVLKRFDRKCSNGGNGTQHRHVHLIQGRAKAAQVYPENWLTVYARELPPRNALSNWASNPGKS